MPKAEKKTDFKPGDRVFAKLKGYPPWPARIDDTVLSKSEVPTNKYPVFFFGTYETGLLLFKDLFHYDEHKTQLAKPTKRKGFNQGLYEIEHCPNLPAKGKFAPSNRPKKRPIDDPEVLDTAASGDELTICDGAPLSKKKRGRKPKILTSATAGSEVKATSDYALVQKVHPKVEDKRKTKSDIGLDPESMISVAPKRKSLAAFGESDIDQAELVVPRKSSRVRVPKKIHDDIDMISVKGSEPADKAVRDRQAMEKEALERAAKGAAIKEHLVTKSEIQQLRRNGVSERIGVKTTRSGRVVKKPVAILDSDDELGGLSCCPCVGEENVCDTIPIGVPFMVDGSSAQPKSNKAAKRLLSEEKETASPSTEKSPLPRNSAKQPPTVKETAEKFLSPTLQETVPLAMEGLSAASTVSAASSSEIEDSPPAEQKGRPATRMNLRHTKKATFFSKKKAPSVTKVTPTVTDQKPSPSIEGEEKKITPAVEESPPQLLNSPQPAEEILPQPEDNSELKRDEVKTDNDTRIAVEPVLPRARGRPAKSRKTNLEKPSRGSTVKSVACPPVDTRVAILAETNEAGGGTESELLVANQEVDTESMTPHDQSSPKTTNLEKMAEILTVKLENPSVDGDCPPPVEKDLKTECGKENGHAVIRMDADQSLAKARDRGEQTELTPREQWKVTPKLNTSVPCLKHQMESGAFTSDEELAERLKRKIAEKEEEKSRKKLEKLQQKKKEKQMFNQTETTLQTLDLRIKESLSISEQDIDECINAMSEMDAIPLTPLLLRNNPDVVDTIRKCRRFKSSGVVRHKADYIYNKFKTMFASGDYESLSQIFEGSGSNQSKDATPRTKAKFTATFGETPDDKPVKDLGSKPRDHKLRNTKDAGSK